MAKQGLDVVVLYASHVALPACRSRVRDGNRVPQHRQGTGRGAAENERVGDPAGRKIVDNRVAGDFTVDGAGRSHHQNRHFVTPIDGAVQGTSRIPNDIVLDHQAIYRRNREPDTGNWRIVDDVVGDRDVFVGRGSGKYPNPQTGG